jgi:transposase-like protein
MPTGKVPAISVPSERPTKITVKPDGGGVQPARVRFDSNNRVECDHGRLKARLRPMRGLQTNRTASIVIIGHAFIQNLRRGHYELGIEARHEHQRLAAAFDELAKAI